MRDPTVMSCATTTPPRGLMLGTVTTVEQVPEPQLPVLPPEEALRRARPLPRRAQLVLEDVPAAEWDKFQQALTEA